MRSAIQTLQSRFGFAAPMILGLMALLALVTLPLHPGGASGYLLFHAACIALALSAFAGPTSHGFSAFAIFLLLGFWLKVVLLTLGIDPLIEPIGNFDGTGAAWDAALSASATGLAAVAAARWLHHAWATKRHSPETRRSVPSWFALQHRIVWAATFIAIAGVTVANWTWRFYMVGMDPLLVLPFRLNVAVAWWLTVASGMWIAALLEWERRLNPGASLNRWMLIPIVEAFVTSTAMLSRGFYLMKVLPYALVLSDGKTRSHLRLRPRALAAVAAVAASGFLLSLVAVSWLRLDIYPRGVRPPSAMTSPESKTPGLGMGKPRADAARTRAREMTLMAHQVTRMIAGRWIGLEGVLAVSSFPGRDLAFWRTAVSEDPGAGNAALYQRIAGSGYRPQPGVTFLTLPGVVAVMAYAGSPWVTALGMVLVTALLLGSEAICRRLFGNEFLCAVVGVAIANILAQMNFPYLAGIFFIELWLTLLGLAVLSSDRSLVRPSGGMRLSRAAPGVTGP